MAVKRSLRAARSTEPEGVGEFEQARKDCVMGTGTSAASSGVVRRAVAMAGRGRNPHSARKGVMAIAISGLWFGSNILFSVMW